MSTPSDIVGNDAAKPSSGPRTEPLVGWRLWRLDGSRLRACVLDYEWHPGTNRAVCLDPRHCTVVPGGGCKCGFWATAGIGDTVRRARTDRSERLWAMGLMRGWGAVAIHGREGFRTEFASIVCLFADWPWSARGGGRLPNWPTRVLETVGLLGTRPHPDRLARLGAAAAGYGVPLLRISDGVEMGVLTEFGLGEVACAEARTVASR